VQWPGPCHVSLRGSGGTRPSAACDVTASLPTRSECSANSGPSASCTSVQFAYLVFRLVRSVRFCKNDRFTDALQRPTEDSIGLKESPVARRRNLSSHLLSLLIPLGSFRPYAVPSYTVGLYNNLPKRKTPSGQAQYSGSLRAQSFHRISLSSSHVVILCFHQARVLYDVQSSRDCHPTPHRNRIAGTLERGQIDGHHMLCIKRLAFASRRRAHTAHHLLRHWPADQPQGAWWSTCRVTGTRTCRHASCTAIAVHVSAKPRSSWSA